MLFMNTEYFLIYPQTPFADLFSSCLLFAELTSTWELGALWTQQT